MNVKFHTLGCKVNQYETQVVAQMFKDGGHTSDDNLPYDVLSLTPAPLPQKVTAKRVKQYIKSAEKTVMPLLFFSDAFRKPLKIRQQSLLMPI